MLHSRIQRVNRSLRNAIGEILLNDMTDPRLRFVTVCHVEVSKDLQSALVFVSVLSDNPGAGPAAIEALENAKGYIKSLLSQRVVLKFLPDLKFRLHQGARHAARIEEVLRDLARERPPDHSEDKSEQ